MPQGLREMIHRSGWYASAAALIGIASTPLMAGAQERHAVSGANIAIYNLVGEVTVEPGTGAEVVVLITRGGSDGDQLRIETGRIGDRETLRVVYPASRIVAPFLDGGERAKLRVRENGTFFGNRGRSEGSRVSVAGSGTGLEAFAHMRIQVPPNKKVAINLGVGKLEASGLDGDVDLNTASAPVTARRMSGKLDVDVGSGTVRISDVNGDLSVDTGSGSVQVETVSGEKINIDTGSGSVRGSGLQATTISIDTGSGSITLGGVAAPRLSMDTGSGSVDLTLDRAPESVDIDTGSGGVTIRSPRGLNAAVDLETGSGSIETDFPLTIRKHSRDHVVGQIGDGSGRIVIETGSGSIRLLERGG